MIGAADRGDIDLRLGQVVAADDIEMRALCKHVSIEEWYATGGRTDHDVFLGSGLFGRMDGDHGDAAKLGHLIGEGAAARVVSTVDLDPLNASHAADGLQLRLGLEPGAEAADDLCIGSSHVFRGHSRGRTRAHLAE